MKKNDRVYTFLCVLFSVIIVCGNLIYQKFIKLNIFGVYSFELSSGAIIYPLTFLISDLIAEFYGKEQARFCVKLAITMNIFVALFIIFIIQFPATHWSNVDSITFKKVFGLYGVAFMGSIMANYIAQLVDIIIYLGIRKITKNKFLWLRSNVSTAISLFIDTLIVISFMTIFGALPKEQMVKLTLNSYSFKILISIFSTPLFYTAVYLIKNYVTDKKASSNIVDQICRPC